MELKTLEQVVTCPRCGNRMKLRGTEPHTFRNGRCHLFYSCLIWPICEATLGSDTKGNPVTEQIDAKTKALRIKCHQILDGWWMLGQITRSEAYELLANIMHITFEQAHFSNFSKEECEEFLCKIESITTEDGYLL